MGFYHQAKRAMHPLKLSQVAVAVLESNLGVWHAGYSRKNPEIQVAMITQITRPLRRPSLPKFWFRRLGGWLHLF